MELLWKKESCNASSWICTWRSPSRDAAAWICKIDQLFRHIDIYLRSRGTYFSSMSCFLRSSLVGKPISFWRWSYIIFSTMLRVSPSRSDSFDGSGLILRVEISGSLVTRRFHQFMRLIFSSVISTVLLSCSTQTDSSCLTSPHSSPSMIGSWPLRPTFSDFLPMLTTMSRARNANDTLNGIFSCN